MKNYLQIFIKIALKIKPNSIKMNLIILYITLFICLNYAAII